MFVCVCQSVAASSVLLCGCLLECPCVCACVCVSVCAVTVSKQSTWPRIASHRFTQPGTSLRFPLRFRLSRLRHAHTHTHKHAHREIHTPWHAYMHMDRSLECVLMRCCHGRCHVKIIKREQHSPPAWPKFANLTTKASHTVNI